MELHMNYPFNFYGMAVQVVAKMANKKLDVKIIDKDTIVSPAYKAQNMTGKFPMLKTPEGNLSESVAIAKFLANGTKMMGANATERAQIDQWCYWALSSLLPQQFPALMGALGHAQQTKEVYAKSQTDTKTNIRAMDVALGSGNWLVGSECSVADIMIAGYFVMAVGSFLDSGLKKAFPKWAAWIERVFKLPQWVAVFGHVKMAQKAVQPKFAEGPKKEEKKKEQPAAKPKKDEGDEDAEPKKDKNPLDCLPETKFDLFNFKTFYVNHPDKKGAAVDELLRQFDNDGWSFWYLQYEKFGTEGQVLFKTINLCNGFMQRFESFRKYSFARHCVLGQEPSLEIEGVWLFRGTGIPQEAIDHPQFEYYKNRRLDVSKPEDVQLIRNFWGGKADEDVNGMYCQHITW